MSYFRLQMSDFFIHPAAIVDEGASIGKGTKIWHFCHIMPGAIIGANCTLGQNVFVDGGVHIGNGVKIQNNVSVYKGVLIEDDVFLGPSVVFTNVINPRSFIDRKAEFRQTLIQRGATIGANATIVCGLEVGEYAMIGAGSVITKNVPSFSLYYGNPARQKGWISKMGYPLQFAGSEAMCPVSGEHYQLIDNIVYSI
jgi:UDP-2-acetamido-3-amino-2,3-dideoxy-glucuronate N-acetyltransferase